MTPEDITWKRIDYPVRLTKYECLFAAVGGVLRRMKCLFAGYRKDCYAESNGDQYWDRDIEGYAAETVVAKHVNWYQEPHIRDSDCYDLGTCLEVRHTTYSTGHLLIRPDDKPGLYVLVTGRMPHLTVIGCYSEKLAKQRYPLSMGPTMKGDLAHWIPQSDLNPFPPRSEWHGEKNPLRLFLEGTK